jgi:hypothetical protein
MPGRTYKTAWRMFNVIRNSLMAENGITLSGTVEMDETYLTPRRRRDEPVWHSGYNPRERAVMGAVECQGKVVACYVPSANRREVERMTDVHVLPATMVYTDTAGIYRRLKGRGYGHERVNHSAGIYARTFGRSGLADTSATDRPERFLLEAVAVTATSRAYLTSRRPRSSVDSATGSLPKRLRLSPSRKARSTSPGAVPVVELRNGLVLAEVGGPGSAESRHGGTFK